MPTKDEFMERFREETARPARCFEGFSEYNENSDATSFHKAVQQAARAAAAAAKEAAEEAGSDETPDPEWFDITRVRILVGNPNVKIYAVTITSTDSGGG